MKVSDWLGIALILIGIFFAIYSYFDSTKKTKNNKSNRSRSVNEVVVDFLENKTESSRKYYEIVARAYSDEFSMSPFSQKSTAFYDVKVFADEPIQKALIYSKKSEYCLYLSDNRESEQKIYLDIDNVEDFFDVEKELDEVVSSSSNYIKNIPELNQILFEQKISNVRIVEKIVKPNSTIFALGEVFLKDNKLFIGQASSSDQPTLIRLHKDLNNLQKVRYRNIALGALCVAVGMIFIVFINK